jgi:hypothetical protein
LSERRSDAAAAHGERSIAIAGSVSNSIVTTGDVVLEVKEDGLGSELRHLLRSERPRKADRRPLPPPPVFADRIDREGEIADVAAGVLRGSVNVYGPPGVGKTYIIRDAANLALPSQFRHGCVFLPGKIEGTEDGLQALFEEFFECDPPARPSDGEIRRDLEKKHAVVFLDSVAMEREELQAFVASAPVSVFVLGSRSRVLWEGQPLFVEGLTPNDGEKLIETELGRRLQSKEHESAAAICAAVDGNPLRLRQASALVRETGRTLAEIAHALAASPERALLEAALDSLTSEQRRLLLSLAAFDGASVGAEHLAAITGTPEVAQTIETLARLHLADSGSPRYFATPVVTDATWIDLEPHAAQALRYFADWAEDPPPLNQLVEEGDALRQLLRRAQGLNLVREGILIARACAPAFAASRRFGGWGEVVRWALGSAESINDLRTLAWALHEEGTRLFCVGRAADAAAMLAQAARVREQMGLSQAAERSRANLRVVRQPRPLFTRFTLLSFATTALLVVLLTLLAAAGVVVASKIDHPASPPAVQPPNGGQGSKSSGCTTCTCSGTCDGGSSSGSNGPILTITVSPESSGSVAAWEGNTKLGTCPTVCRYSQLDVGTTVLLVATSPGSWTFANWGGRCAIVGEPNQCEVTLNVSRSVSATFEPIPSSS